MGVLPPRGRERRRALRILLPVIVAACGTGLWEAVVRIYDIPPYVLPAPSAIFSTLIGDWDVLLQSLLTTLLTTLEGFIAAAVGGIALALLFNLSKLVEYSLFPYAVVLQVTPVIAIAPLLLIYLPQQTAVDRLRLDRRILPRAVQHHARPQFGRPQSRRPVSALPRLALADAALPEAAAALPYILGGLRIAGGLSLIGAVVAEIAAGTRRRGIRPCLSDRRIRLSSQHPSHVRGAVFALARRDCHLCLAGANFPSRIAALARKCAWKGKLMAGTISSEKIDLLIYGPMRPILENGFSDQFVVHSAETRADLERLTPDTVAAAARHGGHLSHGRGRTRNRWRVFPSSR